MADNTLLNIGAGGDTIRTLDRTGTGTPKTEVVQLDLGGADPNREVLIVAGQQVMSLSVPVVIAGDQIPVAISVDDRGRVLDDDGIPFVNPNVPGADIATGDKQTQQLTALNQIAASNPPFAAYTPTVGTVTASGQIIGPVTLSGASRAVVWYAGTFGNVTLFTEVSNDGINWNQIWGSRPAYFTDPGNYIVAANTTTSDSFDVGGYLQFRVRVAAATSGVMNVIITPAAGVGPQTVNAIVSGQASVATASTTRPVPVSGVDGGGLIRNVLTDTTGVVQTNSSLAAIETGGNLTSLVSAMATLNSAITLLNDNVRQMITATRSLGFLLTQLQGSVMDDPEMIENSPVSANVN